MWVPKNISYIVFAITGIVCLIVSAVLYLKIYFAVRHRKQIQSLQVQHVAQNDQIANAARLRKSTVGTVFVSLVFLLCHLPQFCNFAVVVIYNLSAGIKVSSVHVFNHLVISQFIFKSCHLLLEDETHSTRCHGHTTKCPSKRRHVRILVCFPS